MILTDDERKFESYREYTREHLYMSERIKNY